MRIEQPHLSFNYEKDDAESIAVDNKNVIDILQTANNDLELLLSGRRAIMQLLSKDDLKREEVKEKLSELSSKIVELRIRISAYEREFGLE